ncbi:MAG: hypothetical protein M3228_05110 [Actinomycetota bacterium]|nr:hypothetical protein [Actinomycetota bacterium]
MPHSSIAGTFVRKFLSAQARDYLGVLGQGWAGPAERCWIQESLNGLGSVLAPLLRSAPSRVVIYGDLKPEHVLLDPAGWQIWIDPGLQRADPVDELAELVSRTALLLVTAAPSCARITAIINALDQLVIEHVAHHEPTEPPALQRLVSLWLADWANCLATGLSLAPSIGLPLPPTVLAPPHGPDRCSHWPQTSPCTWSPTLPTPGVWPYVAAVGWPAQGTEESGEPAAPPGHHWHHRRGPSRTRGDRSCGRYRCGLHRPGAQPSAGGERRSGHRRGGPGRHPAHPDPDRRGRAPARAARRHAAHRVCPGAVHQHHPGPAGWAVAQCFAGRRPRTSSTVSRVRW